MKHILYLLLFVISIPTFSYTGNNEIIKLKTLEGKNLVHYCHYGLVYLGSYQLDVSAINKGATKRYIYTPISKFIDHELNKQMTCAKYNQLELQRILLEIKKENKS